MLAAEDPETRRVIDVDDRLGEPADGESGGPGLLRVEAAEGPAKQASAPEPGEASSRPVTGTDT